MAKQRRFGYASTFNILNADLSILKAIDTKAKKLSDKFSKTNKKRIFIPKPTEEEKRKWQE